MFAKFAGWSDLQRQLRGSTILHVYILHLFAYFLCSALKSLTQNKITHTLDLNVRKS